jgi:hypothetical protein
MTISSYGTFAASRRRTRSTVELKRTLRSSSPWMSSTGDFQVAMDDTGDERHATAAALSRSVCS